MVALGYSNGRAYGEPCLIQDVVHRSVFITVCTLTQRTLGDVGKLGGGWHWAPAAELASCHSDRIYGHISQKRASVGVILKHRFNVSIDE